VSCGYTSLNHLMQDPTSSEIIKYPLDKGQNCSQTHWHKILQASL